MSDTYLYDAWGNPLTSTGSTVNPFRYVGRLGYYADLDTLNYYIRARNYRPSIARWLSTDPLGFVDGLNLYKAYFAPNWLDPKGTSFIHCVCFYHASRPIGVSNVNVDCRGNGDACCQAVCEDLAPCHARTAVWDWWIVGPSNDGSGCRFFARPDITGNMFADTLQCAHYDIYSTCHGEIVTGIGGAEGVQTTESKKKDIELYQVGFGVLAYGSDSGTPCRSATYGSIMDCIKNRPHPGEYSMLGNNCQQDVERTANACCLRGFKAIP